MATPNGVKSQSRMGPTVLFYSILLTLQYGAQPLISKRCIGKEVIVTSSVLTCEIVKVICALILMARDGSLKKLAKEWTLMGSLTASGLPAAIYALQNSLLQISYRSLDSLTFSILNQTKIFFTAFFTFIILRQKQSVQQIGALCLLIMAAVLLSVGEGSNKSSSGSVNPEQVLFYGIIPVLVASVLSGLASSLCQWASQVKKHSSYLMTVEMSIVGSLCLLVSTLKSPDGEAIKRHGFFHGWTALTMVPVISNALGGILVGLVTSHAGGVRKFAFEGKPPSSYCLVALPLVISSISLYQKYPYLDKKKKKAVGKTSIITCFMYGNFDTNYQATIGIDFLSKTMRHEDTTFHKQSFINASKWIEDVHAERGNQVIIALVGNKTDLVHRRQVSIEEGDTKARELGALFIETSAKAGFNIKPLFCKIASALQGTETQTWTRQEDLVDVNLKPMTNSSHSQQQQGNCSC
ncbi:hypothetical protein IGI04_033674 [Brassica rapa subsp. trilocularis]|uniref:Uncharacterized protein n=1 Tax=Brassica rapa subsp. trilocularis TaxID=1813537 RepID=A0ABQ7L6I8_BRACM|nr:hypothetical protein IGI04_033674 [Brassica rapa subsp. trilocularis]